MPQFRRWVLRSLSHLVNSITKPSPVKNHQFWSDNKLSSKFRVRQNKANID